MEEKTFTISFVKMANETTCDFCENNPVGWWCEELVTGYCKECMEEQELSIPQTQKMFGKIKNIQKFNDFILEKLDNDLKNLEDASLSAKKELDEEKEK